MSFREQPELNNSIELKYMKSNNLCGVQQGNTGALPDHPRGLAFRNTQQEANNNTQREAN